MKIEISISTGLMLNDNSNRYTESTVLIGVGWVTKYLKYHHNGFYLAYPRRL